jgi:inner membrane protein
MEQENASFTEKLITKIRTSATTRLFLIGFLILVLLIPSGMIESLVMERQGNHDAAINEISDKWGHDQHITGPIIAIPYLETVSEANNQVHTIRSYAYYLPGDVEISGKMESQRRHRGIYEAVLYETKLHIKGSFEGDFIKTLPALPANALVNEARLVVGISDVRSIRNKAALRWDSATIKARARTGRYCKAVLASL